VAEVKEAKSQLFQASHENLLFLLQLNLSFNLFFFLNNKIVEE
jgi:hypothetical protein